MRDPRVDPKAGDILTNGTQRVMIHIVDNGVVYFGSEDCLGGYQMCIEQYRLQAKDAEVLHVAD